MAHEKDDNNASRYQKTLGGSSAAGLLSGFSIYQMIKSNHLWAHRNCPTIYQSAQLPAGTGSFSAKVGLTVAAIGFFGAEATRVFSSSQQPSAEPVIPRATYSGPSQKQ
jgi:hypothetical protein